MDSNPNPRGGKKPYRAPSPRTLLESDLVEGARLGEGEGEARHPPSEEKGNERLPPPKLDRLFPFAPLRYGDEEVLVLIGQATAFASTLRSPGVGSEECSNVEGICNSENDSNDFEITKSKISQQTKKPIVIDVDKRDQIKEVSPLQFRFR